MSIHDSGSSRYHGDGEDDSGLTVVQTGRQFSLNARGGWTW